MARFCGAMAFAVLLVIVATTSASPLAAAAGWAQQEPDVTPHDARTSSWVRLHRAAAEQQVVLTVALRVDPEPLAVLERILLEVSDPGHPRYGQHMSQDEVTALLAVPPARADKVAGYFRDAGASSVATAPNGDMLTVNISASGAGSALGTELHVFQHTEHVRVRIVRAAKAYFLPLHIAEHVSIVGELLQFPRLPPKRLFTNASSTAKWQNFCDASACANMVTPGVLAKRYNLPDQTTPMAEDARNSMAVAEFGGEFWDEDELKAFGKSCHRDVTVAKNIGRFVPDGSGQEADLDVMYIKAVAPEIPLTVIYSDYFSLLDWANQINSMSDAALVHSISFGNDEGQQISEQYMQTCNTAFMKAGVRGMSILVASGDLGICGREGCGQGRFNPDFPASSPYITAVGGTDFEGDDIGAETAWSYGGGGFSDTFDIPSWQADAVAAYTSNPDAKLPPQRMWNRAGRGYPDVAALAGTKNPYCIYNRQKFQGVAGTSASSPVVAGVFAKLNGLRLRKDQPPLGFLNPFIYKNPSAFHDVVSGRNDRDTSYGFTAIKGWDAATGMGTPDFGALSSLVTQEAAAVQQTTLNI